MIDLATQHCKPCQGAEESLSSEQVTLYAPSVPDWAVEQSAGHPQLVREIKLQSFVQVLERVQSIGELAEAEGHHPNLYLHSYNRLRIEIFTHKTHGLHLNDFILARKIDLLFEQFG